MTRIAGCALFALIPATVMAAGIDEVLTVGLSQRQEVNVSTAAREGFRRDLRIDYPEDNLPNAAREALGKTLFFDPRLSRSGSQSCASCHNPSLSWGDGLAVGVGDQHQPLARRSPTILNLAWSEPLMWDGRAETLEDQALGPIVSGVEMNMTIEETLERLDAIDGYRPLFAAAFDGDDAITSDRVALAIAAFERTVVSGTAPFDRWIEGEDEAISDAAERGFALFVGEANCAACHEGWRFTDDSFHDVGLESDDLGRGAHVPAVEVMQHAFKTPGLRNIAERGPYMHDGSLDTLVDVVRHYDEGGVERPSRSEEIYPIGLSDRDVADIVAFLETLTGDDPDFVVPILPR